MERTIILSDKESTVIDASSIRDLNNGIILVYQDTKIIGSVIFNSNEEEFLLSTVYESDYYYSIGDILEQNPEYTFKYIAQDI